MLFIFVPIEKELAQRLYYDNPEQALVICYYYSAGLKQLGKLPLSLCEAMHLQQVL